ncbi:MAG: DNA-directed RNA polymerase subunit D [Nanoarchaeota archaeon]
MKLIKKTEEKIIISEEIEDSLINAIRRFVHEIPILAIDEVEIFKNDSALYDETIAHRLGLIPLKMDKSVEEMEKCTCKGKGCNKCTVTLKLAVNKEGGVYSKELKGKVEAVYDKTPIVFLNKGQEIEIVVYARLGRGREHSKFVPGLVFYRNVPEIKRGKDEKEGTVYNSRGENVEKMFENDLLGETVEIRKKEGKEFVRINPTNEMVVEIESFGQISPKEIFIDSIKELRDKLREIEKDLKIA